jgi:large subunit ribosomal protein L2
VSIGKDRAAGSASARTRGVAMNPVDHPLGGGEGKTRWRRHQAAVEPADQGLTRNNKSTDKFIVTRRKK